MIKPEELRIGNIVLLDDGVTMPSPHVIQPLDIAQIASGFPSGIKIEPYKLTENWLLKFGFEKERPLNSDHEEDGIWYNGFPLFQSWHDGKIHFATRFRGGEFKSGYEIKHIHQLQNLYFALTNEELTAMI